MDAKGILKQWLTENGHDGLCTYECGCGLDDLIVCGQDPANCVPARKITVEESNEDAFENCPLGDEAYTPSNDHVDRETKRKLTLT